MTELALTVPDEALELIAQRAAEIVVERLGTDGGSPCSPWLTRAQAATYLSVPVSRLEKDRRIPCHRDGGRVFYHRAELDEHFLAFGRDG